MSVLVVTSLGDIVIDLLTNRCPLTSKNFLKLCKIKYYNGCLFHNVQKDFAAQTGDPTGTGTGGDSIYKFLYGDQARFFSDELHLDLKHTKMGTVSMASAGENLNASQFYITLRDDLDYLDGKHTVFGEVAEGFDTLARINESYVDDQGRPYKDIRIKHTYVLDDPFDDPPQLSGLIPDASPEGKPRDEVVDDVRLEDDWVPMDEKMDVAELQEAIRSKEAHSRAVVLESIGDIPDVDIKPPENVLFVCKLNPVTEDDDLHTIFSRFGTVTSAEVIRDYKTGDSLCYAFIEFESNEACEQAYFKMDNALIDDRRIHVDFSQSVAKLWNQFRRKGSKQGRGCFKCGALDHVAKDCTADSAGPAVKQHQQKFTLKDDGRQRGGDGNARFDMVFDEQHERSPHLEKRQKERGNDDERRSRRSSKDDIHNESGDKYGKVDNRTSQHHRSRAENKHDEKTMDLDQHRRSLIPGEDKASLRRYEKSYRERSGDRHNERDQRDGEEYRKTSRDDDSWGRRKEEADYGRRDGDGKVREKREKGYDGKVREKREKGYDPGHRRSDRDGDDHRSRKKDLDYERAGEGPQGDQRGYDDRRGKRDEEESRKRHRDEHAGSTRRREDSENKRRSKGCDDDKHIYDERRESRRR